MNHYTTTSSFQSLPINIYHYPATQESSQVVLLLKGLYGLHIPGTTTSWEGALIPLLTTDIHVICINTSRIGDEDEVRSSKDAFVGKTFAQECEDIERAYRYLCDEKVLPVDHILSVIGNSFGGTTLLGAPYLLEQASVVIMIGSGCGKSATTTKPLLATLLDEKELLSSLRSYTGIFAFVRGALDSVVPHSSQEKIMQSASSARVNMRYEIAHADHDLTSITHHVNRTTLIDGLLRHTWGLLR